MPFEASHYRELLPGDANRLPQGGCRREKRASNVLANHCHRTAQLLFGARKKTPLFDRNLAHLGQRIGNAENARGLIGLAIGFHILRMLLVRAVKNTVARCLPQISHIGWPDAFVVAQLVRVIARTETPHARYLRHQKTIASKSSRRDSFGISAESIDRRADHDHAGYAHDDPEQRQETAQLVDANRVERQRCCNEKFG